MLHTFRIHIGGLVQGVGFRPLVCKLAQEMDVKGWVSNTNTGVIIVFNATENIASSFYKDLTSFPPQNAIITFHHFHKIAFQQFSDFTIRQHKSIEKPDLLLTPDWAICDNCKKDITNSENKRYQYAFATCLNCGPRYSIINDLPYDRLNTSMSYLQMCPDCNAEYNDIDDRRYFSQTNSCKSCAVHLKLYNKSEHVFATQNEILQKVVNHVLNGKVVAVKGIGGYLFICDATSAEAIEQLRIKKNRPSKPFAILYKDIQMALEDVELRNCEIEALSSKSAPIVLCAKKVDSGNHICFDAIAPQLDKIGVMLAYSPLLYLLSSNIGKPIIATSANQSGSPIIYQDEEAIDHLFDVADLVLAYEREILVPQDDSVIQFTQLEQQIILRRSRGLAPNYFPNPYKKTKDTILAMGGELKSAFALLDQQHLYISQFLGNQEIVESQMAYSNTLNHLLRLLKIKPQTVLVDAHPDYCISQAGKEISANFNCNPVVEIQHHKAHFGAVLAENNLLQVDHPILGIVWDGTGYGSDQQIWGSEFFLYEKNEMKRVAHLQYFSHLVGDKMSKEPRLSALSLLHNFPQYHSIIQAKFTDIEWGYYSKLLQTEKPLLTSSMGRFLDGLACILGISDKQSYEGEAAMKLETLARKSINTTSSYYSMVFTNDIIEWDNLIHGVLIDLNNGIKKEDIAYKILYSLVKLIAEMVESISVDHIAFSGGVFQNALITDLIKKEFANQHHIYFHKQLSPNDECIGFGQLACFEILQNNNEAITHSKETSNPIFLI